jgi:hypothetical protein
VAPLSVQNQPFADAVNACVAGKATAILTVEALAGTLGFSERAVTFVEQLFGDSNKLQKE